MLSDAYVSDLVSQMTYGIYDVYGAAEDSDRKVVRSYLVAAPHLVTEYKALKGKPKHEFNNIMFQLILLDMGYLECTG